MNIQTIRALASPGDVILTGHDGIFSIGGLIQYLTKSRYSHGLFYCSPDTIAESTMDYTPYKTTGKRLDNGPQFNHLSTLEKVDYGVLIHFTKITDSQRIAMLDKITQIIEDGKYVYDLTGLIGSLITYKLFPFFRENPLSTGMYCTCFTSAVKRKVLGPEYDPSPRYKDNNTSPEMEWQWVKNNLDKVQTYYL